MELDKNKTPETHRATAVASAYLDLRGFKPIETEVPVFDGWVADLASYVYPSNTELEKLKLVGRIKTKYGRCIDDEAVNRFVALNGPGPYTAIVEVKVTKADCKKDLDFKFAGRYFPAHLCYLAYPKGLMEKPPKGWIGLILNERCDRLIKTDFSYVHNVLHPQYPGSIADLIASVGIRRHHRTHYTELKAWVKSFNADRTKEKREYNIHNALRALEEYLFGGCEKEFDEMLRYHGVRGKVINKSIKEIAEKIRHKLKGGA